MRHPCKKMTLRWLMGVVSLLCLLLAFLRHALRYWGPGEVTIVALTILLVTNILAWFQGTRWQVFWVGFGIFGWAYLMISLAPSTSEHLPTTWLLDNLHDRLYPIPAAATFGDNFDEPVALHEHGFYFRRAGHSVISLGLAFLGGVAASLLFPGKYRGSEETLPPDGSLLAPGWIEEQRKRSRELP